MFGALRGSDPIMQIKRGIAVSPGVAIGPALVLHAEGYRIPQRFLQPSQVPAELERLHTALAAAASEIHALQQELTRRLGSEHGAIFAAHALFFDDPSLTRELDQLIRGHHYTAEYALSRVIRRYVKAIEGLGADHFLSTRAADLYDLERRVFDQLLGQQKEPLHDLREPVIVVSHDLSPSETAALDPDRVFGFATESGGRTSHTAIIAGALELPAVVGVGRFLSDVPGGELVIVDGDQGLLILDPDEETLEQYEKQRLKQRRQAAEWVRERDLVAETLDGVRIPLLGNIEFPEETRHCLDWGAEGVGLYRTEFLYVGKETDPSEADHLNAYMKVIESLPSGQPLVIRTLDIGADKFTSLPWIPTQERNPFLGLRSVRLCLRNLTLFKTQMRAILKASAFGNVRILFPMVSTILELRQCKMVLAEVKEDLEEEGIPFQTNIPIGTMIEVPSAALMADQFAREVSFFSVGTNDLVQYTLAADRNNENVAPLYNPADPAVLRLLRTVIEAVRQTGIEANVCGEMSGEPIFALLLLGMGFRQLSTTPHNIPEVKRVIRKISIVEAEQVASGALQLETARDVTNYLREHTRRLLQLTDG